LHSLSKFHGPFPPGASQPPSLPSGSVLPLYVSRRHHPLNEDSSSTLTTKTPKIDRRLESTSSFCLSIRTESPSSTPLIRVSQKSPRLSATSLCRKVLSPPLFSHPFNFPIESPPCLPPARKLIDSLQRPIPHQQFIAKDSVQGPTTTKISKKREPPPRSVDSWSPLPSMFPSLFPSSYKSHCNLVYSSVGRGGVLGAHTWVVSSSALLLWL